MLSQLRALDKSALAVFVFGLSFFALLYSKWLLSLSLFLLIPLALINILQSQRGDESFSQAAKKYLSIYLNYPPYWTLGIIFIVVFLSGLLLGGSDYWLSRMRIKLPLLIAPILFAFIAPLSLKYYRRWIYLMLLLALASLALILIQYGINYTEIQDRISKGGTIATPISHIRYSIFLAFSMALGLWLFIDKKVFHRRIRLLGLTCGLLLFIGLHILSVRTGLIAAYLAVFLSLTYWIIKEKKWTLGFVLMALVAVGPWLAYKNIPSFKSKVDYTLYDLSMYQKGEGAHYSDGERIYSLKAGWEIFKRQPLFGTGIGNFKATIDDYYAKNNDKGLTPKMPHNQFLSIMASTGIIGLLISLIGILTPLFYKKNYRHLPLLVFYLILLTSMLVENTLETSVGLALFLLPILIMNNYLIGAKSD